MTNSKQNPYQRLIWKAVSGNNPISATLELTYVCNLHCRFCYNPIQRKSQLRSKPIKAPTGEILRFEEILHLLDQLEEMGVLSLTLTGGEPMLHPRFWDIAEAAKERHFSISIFTNGTLIDEAAAKRFRDLCPNRLGISIHGATSETAESLNQVPGAHERLLGAVRLLRSLGVRVILKCVLTKLMENEIESMKSLAAELDAPLFFDPVVSPAEDGDTFPLDLIVSEPALSRLFKGGGPWAVVEPIEREEGNLNCMVASGTLHIDPFGNVRPCTQWKEVIGSLRERPLRDIWFNTPRLEQIRKMNRTMLAELKGKTPDFDFCHHCPALSLLRYGDPARPEEQHLRSARLRRRCHEESSDTKPQ